jgi:tetratricopeptide (TPR) repeat protein
MRGDIAMPGWDPEANDLFLRAREIPAPEDRQRFLDEACAGKPELRARVEGLLRAGAEAGSFLERPAQELGATGAFAPGPQDERTSLPREGPGTVIGPYKLLELVGEGGMGTVWMADQTEPIQRRVAIKVVKEGMDSKQVLARFEAERQALALMDHPNIAKVLDANRTPSGRPYFVMELVKGKSITTYCDEKHLGVPDRLKLFGEVCRAVQHAHQKGIIHRDLKPSNVLVAPYDGKPVVKVIDFGVAKATGQRLTDKTLFTGFGALVGTPEYMSPEQAEVNNQDIDTRSDIYSLGVLLYELLTGSTPLTRKRLKEAALLEVLRVIREEEPPRPSTRLAESKDSLPSISAQRQTEPAKLTKLVRGELDWIVMKALEKDRNRRYETANGFAMDVQRYLADEPVLAGPPSAWYRFRKFARRNRAGVLTMAGALVLMVVAGGGIWSWRHEQTLRRAEKNFHAELTRRSAESSLEQLPELHRRALWKQAETLLDQADKQLGPDGDADLRDRLGQAQRDTAFIKRLDKIRLDKSVLVEGRLNFAGALAGYPKVFLENGFDVLDGDPGEVAAKLHASAVREHLVAAMDDWAMAESRNNRRRIMAVTATATGQAWRSQFGNVKDAIGLAALYDAIPQNERTPAIIIAVANTLNAFGQDGIPRMESGLRQYPGDFWLHMVFGSVVYNERPETAIGAFRAALAVRPHTAAGRINLGYLLRDKREHDAAIAECKEASRIDPKSALPHICLGDVLRDKKEYAAAIAEYNEAIRLDPKSAWPHYGLGSVLNDKREYDAAIAECKEAIRLDPQSAWPHRGLGDVLRDKREYDAAVAEYKEAMRLDPKFAGPHSGLGDVLRDKREYAAAIAEYKEAMRLDPKFAMPHHGLGNLLLQKKEYAAAIAACKEAMRLDPKWALPHNGLGLVLYAKKEYAAAIVEYKEAMRLDPKFASPHHNLGNVLRAKKDDAAASIEYKEAIRLDPEFAEPHNGLGNVLNEKKEYEAAAAEYKEAIRLDPKLAMPHNNLGNVLRDKKEYEAAVVEYKEAIRLDPNLALPHNELGNVLYAKNAYAAAVDEYKQAMRLDPQWALPHGNLANVLAAKKEYAAAVAEFKAAIRLDPNLALAHYGLGHVLYDKKEYDAAVAELKEALRLDPGDALAYANLGLTYRRLGRLSESVAAFGEAAKLMPKEVRIQHDLHFSKRWLVLDRQLTAIRQGSAEPKTPAEAVGLAELAIQDFKREFSLAVRLFADAFAADAKLMAANRYNAAAAAALAGCGQGKDADKLADKERARLRGQALDWLRADLVAWGQLLDKETEKPAHAVEVLRYWLADADFAGVRGSEALAKLPESERADWQKLWNDVAELLKRAETKAGPEKK